MKTIVFGAALIDIHASSFSDVILNDSNPGTITFSPGGVGRNIAENLALLGEEVALATPYCNDHFGNILRDHALGANIDMRLAYEVKEATTPVYVAIFDPDGSMKTAVSDTQATESLPIDFLTTNHDSIDQCEIIVLAGNYDTETITALCQRYQHKKIVVDPISSTKAKRYASSLATIHTLKCNVLEAAALTQLSDPPSMAEHLISQGVRQVFITLGDQGVFYSDGVTNGYHTPNTNIPIVNLSGAGDSFTAGVVVGIHYRYPTEKIAAFSSAIAQLNVGVMGSVNDGMTLAHVHSLLP